MTVSHRPVLSSIGALVFLFLSTLVLHAQQVDRSAVANPKDRSASAKPVDRSAPAKPADHPAAANTLDPKTYGGMKWRLIGPFRGGRALAVTGVPSQPNTYYFGAAAGGVWKTMDGGVSWDPLFDKQTTSSIGSIAVSNSDPNVIYVGTGEACIRGNISFGDGEGDVEIGRAHV